MAASIGSQLVTVLTKENPVSGPNLGSYRKKFTIYSTLTDLQTT